MGIGKAVGEAALDLANNQNMTPDIMGMFFHMQD